MRIFTTALLLTASMTPLSAQWVNQRTAGIPRAADGKPNLAAPAPRAADGKPDFTGLWEMITDTAVGTVASRPVGDLKPADVQPWARALVQQRAENFGKDNPSYRCLPEGPNSSATGGMKRFLQTPALIAILNEDLTVGVIFMDWSPGRGRP